MTDQFDADAYYDNCSICGAFQLFERTKKAIRETYKCKSCGALLRDREQARAIVLEYGHGNSKTLDDLVKDPGFTVNRIYEPGTSGPFRNYFKNLPFYYQSVFYDQPEDLIKHTQLPHQSIESLTYNDSVFDLVITSDIFEHVRRPSVAFAEIARVLRVGGFHIFTVPLQDPLLPKSIARVKVDGDIDIHLLPERYHGNGKGGRSLVYTDFGQDIAEMLTVAGFSTKFLRPKTQSAIVNSVVTLVTRRTC